MTKKKKNLKSCNYIIWLVNYHFINKIRYCYHCIGRLKCLKLVLNQIEYYVIAKNSIFIMNKCLISKFYIFF